MWGSYISRFKCSCDKLCHDWQFISWRGKSPFSLILPSVREFSSFKSIWNDPMHYAGRPVQSWSCPRVHRSKLAYVQPAGQCGRRLLPSLLRLWAWGLVVPRSHLCSCSTSCLMAGFELSLYKDCASLGHCYL